MKHNVAELEGALLDAAVTLAEHGKTLMPYQIPYSTSWYRAGQIIDRERIAIAPAFDRRTKTVVWFAWHEGDKGHDDAEAGMQEPGDYFERLMETGTWPQMIAASGSTPLIAAMRCRVAAKFGEEVDLPEQSS